MVAGVTTGANRNLAQTCDTRGMAIDPALLDILVCPLSKASLVEIDGALVSTDPETRMRYRVDGGIPVMLVEEAERMPMDEWKEAMANA